MDVGGDDNRIEWQQVDATIDKGILRDMPQDILMSEGSSRKTSIATLAL